MNLVSKREYLSLFVGDVLVFVFSLWLTLLLRYDEMPSHDLFVLHLVPFSVLSVIWVLVFFIAGLYGKHTRLFRSRLPTLIFTTQLLNILIAAAFFFLIPGFGIAPKTNLFLYLLVSAPLIFFWRVLLFSRMRISRSTQGVLIAAGPDAEALKKEVEGDTQYAFSFQYFINTAHAPTHEVIQRACRVAEEKEIVFVAVDYADPAVAQALPIIYDAAFKKTRFALIDIIDLYQEVFDRVPLTLMRYAWVLRHVGASRAYDVLKRGIDIFGALVVGVCTIWLYPIVMLAIKLDDGGDVFIAQERVGRFEKIFRMHKFRSMSGNDMGAYGEDGKSKLVITRVGKWIRLLRIDELPQLWSVLKGDLSLVGPRPELPALVAQYNARIPYYNARYFVTPGLTGWAQIKHDRDPHHGAAVAETKEKLSYDLYYLEHRSLFLDIFILLQTIRVIFTAKGS